jgi:hypothetical protein
VDLLLVTGLAMVLLHRVDGGVVHVAPSQITSMHAAATPGRNIVANPAARCAVWLADGRVLSVTETCEVVRRLLEEAHQ